MSRKARSVLKASFFHVIVQGINKEFIFKEERFKNQYLKELKKNIKKGNIGIIAFCIMGNHAHFLLEAKTIDEISTLMQKTNSAYAKYYNYINERVGYVFRDRFLSEPVMNQRYFIQCIKYIHLNPVKAKIVQKCSDYKYSSFNYYLENEKEIIKEKNISEQEYVDICNATQCNRNFLDIDRDIHEDIENGIAEFMYLKKKNIYNLLNERNTFKELLFFLKINENIKYKDICAYFEISKKLIKTL